MLQNRLSIPQSEVQTYTSALLAAYAGASVLFSPVAGYIADRTSSRQAPFLGGLAALIAATIMLFEGNSIAVLFIARIAQGASSAFVWTVGLALCIDTVGPENLGKTIGSIFSFISVGGFAAPTIGGVVYRKAGENGVLGVSIGIIAIDLIMRLLVIEKKVAKKYDEKDPNHRLHSDNNDQHEGDDNDTDHNENSPLLGSKSEDEDPRYILAPPEDQPWILRHIPILLCFKHPSLWMAFLIALTQALFLSSFDATIPTHASSLYGFDSLKSGLLFLPLGILDLIMGPLAGWATDKYGTKLLAVAGYTWLVPALILLRIPSMLSPQSKSVAVYCVLLSICGVGLATIGAPSIVEAGSVVDKFYKRNPRNFPEGGPYAQLYGFNSMIFSAGLALGPVLTGGLRGSLGYGNANAVLAAISGGTAVACYVALGGKPRLLGGKGII
jgi:MFS family permease